MTIKVKFLQKTVAIALATLFLSTPLTNIAAAAPRHDAPLPRHEQRVEHRRDDKKHDFRKDKHKENRKHDKHKKHEVRHDKHRPPKHEVHKRPDHHPEHRPAPPREHHKHRSNNDKAIGGFILGAVLGAVIANNT